jgi:choline transport protein
MYGINDLDAVLTSSGTFPLATVYAQATGSRPATFGLLFIVFISIFICAVGTYVTVCNFRLFLGSPC